MGNFTAEQMEKAKAAKSVEELLVLAKENGVEMTEEEAGAYYAQLHPTSGEMADEELENVAGGGCHGKDGRLVVTGGYSCDGWEMNYMTVIYNFTKSWALIRHSIVPIIAAVANISLKKPEYVTAITLSIANKVRSHFKR